MESRGELRHAEERTTYRRETTRDFLIIPLLFSSYYSWLSRVLFIPTTFSPETSMRLKPPRSCQDMIRSLPSWSVLLLSLQIGNFQLHSDFFISFHSSQVRGMPQYGAQYKAAIARMFRDCGRGKALYFEETRSVNSNSHQQNLHLIARTLSHKKKVLLSILNYLDVHDHSFVKVYSPIHPTIHPITSIHLFNYPPIRFFFRAYIEFDKSSSAHSARGSTILPAVYLAIKMR